MKFTKNYLDLCFQKNLSEKNNFIGIGAMFFITSLGAVFTLIIEDILSIKVGVIVIILALSLISFFVSLFSYKPMIRCRKIVDKINKLGKKEVEIT